MPRQVAHDYLVAAAEAWPFVSEASFHLRTLRLTRLGPSVFDDATSGLAEKLEFWLRPRAGGISLENLRRIFESTWFPSSKHDVRPLADVLADIASRNLQLCGPAVVLKRDHDLPERLAHARWSSLLLPPDLLVAAVAAHDGLEPPDDHVQLGTPQIERLLEERPVADTHLHLGAAASFSILWSALLPSLGKDLPTFEQLKEVPLGGARPFAHLLVAAATNRLLLARFLRRRERNEANGSLRADFETSSHSFAARLGWTWGAENATRALRFAMSALVTGEVHPELSPPRLQMLYRVLQGVRQSRAANILELLAQDSLSDWLAPAHGKALPETRFSTRAISYLLHDGRNDSSFATLFWQYQRVRGALYRFLVQEPGTSGLDWFRTHFDRLRPFRPRMDSVRVEIALAQQSRGVNLGALEGRIGPPGSWAELRNEIRDAARQALTFVESSGKGPLEIGLVMHWLKEKEHGKGKAQRLHADPAQQVHRVRFGVWGYRCLRNAMSIERALDVNPELLLVLRGLDVASSELAVPTWPLVPLFERVREASKIAAARLRKSHPKWEVRPLRATCHAGEDYGRLVDGLRRIHELIEFGILGQGDRIGHGLALGDDPSRLAQSASRSVQPAEERLDDLLWELDRYACGDLDVDAARFAQASAEAKSRARQIYRDGVDLDDLREARRMRHDPYWLDRFGYPFRRAIEPSSQGVESLLARYLRDRSVFLRGQELVEVQTNASELRFLGAAQAFVRREVARLEITVESNPSSNLLIGDFVAVEEHPSFRMAPLPGKPTPDRNTLLLSINSDDPTTFATCLADEFAHLYGALLRSSVASPDALAWLAARRDEGYRSRFTSPVTKREDVLAVVARGGHRS